MSRPHAAGFLAVEFQRRIGLEEMVVRTDLDRAVAGVGDGERHGLAAGIELDLAVLDEEFAGDHLLPSLRHSGRMRSAEPGISTIYNLWIPGSAASRPPRNDDALIVSAHAR